MPVRDRHTAFVGPFSCHCRRTRAHERVLSGRGVASGGKVPVLIREVFSTRLLSPDEKTVRRENAENHVFRERRFLQSPRNVVCNTART